MDYEKAYKDALERARQGLPIDEVFPELKESEDERIRSFLYEFIQICGWSEKQYPPREECLAYLKRQKEQKPAKCIDFDNEFENQVSHLIASVLNGEHEYSEGFVKYAVQSLLGYAQNELKPVEWSENSREIQEPSYDELQRHQDELHDFKVFAAKQAREYHISFVHDFEWDNFCAELLSYFNEKEQQPSIKEPKYESFEDGNATGWRIKQKPAEGDNETEIQKAFREGKSAGRKEVFEHPEEYGLQKEQEPAEWSEEDEKMLKDCSVAITSSDYYFSYEERCAMDDWLKSLRPQPHWKPSKEQMKHLKRCFSHGHTSQLPNQHVLESLYNDLKRL